MSSSDARAQAVRAALSRRSLDMTHSPPMSPSSSSSTDPLRSLMIFVVGAPGAGKTTQCAALAAAHSFHHVVFDDFLRLSLAYATDKQSKRKSASASSPVPSFIPALSSSQLSALTRAHTSKQTIPSAIRARILYSAMQSLSAAAPLFRYLVDGYLDSEDDWNEWAALIAKRQEERDDKGAPSVAAAIGFLPPIIIRLVCSESVGQLRWRRQQLLATKGSAAAASAPSASEVKSRSMRYSLRTRPMIYRLGMVSAETQQRKAHVKAFDKAGDAKEGDEGEEEEDDESDDDDPDKLAVIHGMIVKRVDAEVPVEACYADMEALVRSIIQHTLEADWTRITGYETDDEVNDAAVAEPPALLAATTPAFTVVEGTPNLTSTATTSTLSVPVLSSAGATSSSSNLPVPVPVSPESDSPAGVNWQEDPAEAEELAESEREERERLERTQRMLRLIEAEEEKWRLEQEKEEARERRRMDEEIRRLREREELVEAESGHIRTRRDDRFVTFISVGVAVSIAAAGVKEGEGQVWVEVYRGFEREGGGGEVRWLSVMRTAKLPVTSMTIAFPRAIVNTWKLSGNERERPVMFRLYHSPLPSAASASSSSTAAAPAKPTAPPTLLGESRTMLQHLLLPPEEKGLTLTLRRAAAAAATAHLLVAPASMHTLLKPAKIIPPHRLHTVMQDRVIIPASIPVHPSNLLTADPAAAPPQAAAASAEEVKASDKDAASKERRKAGDGERRHRTRDDSDVRASREQKERDRGEEADVERLLREMDEQIGVSPRKRRHSFNAPSIGDTASAGAASPRKSTEEQKTQAKREPSRSIVDQAKSAFSRLSITAPPPAVVAVKAKLKKESKLERERRELLEARKTRKRQEAKDLARRAASRERRRRELARIKKRAQVQKVSLLTVDCAAFNLPKQGLFTEGKFYLQVYRKRDRVKERERALKAANVAEAVAVGRGRRAKPVPVSVKLPDMFPPGARNYCVHASHRHLVKPSLWSLVYSSPVTSTLSPAFAPFLLPLDDQPLLFVVLSSQCSHRHDVVNERLKAHDGKDRVVGVARLSVEDVVKMAIIQQREWDVDIYSMVDREKEKEKRRESRVREIERKRAKGDHVDEHWEDDDDRQAEEQERAQADKHRVSVVLKDAPTLEKERETRKARRDAKKKKTKKAGSAPVPVSISQPDTAESVDSDSSDDDDDEDDSAPIQLGPAVPLLSFFSLAFFTTRPVVKEEVGGVEETDYTAGHRRASAGSGRGMGLGATQGLGGTQGLGKTQGFAFTQTVGSAAFGGTVNLEAMPARGSFTVRADKPASE